MTDAIKKKSNYKHSCHKLFHFAIQKLSIKIFNYFFFSGVINRGDSFRRRRSRSNSLAPTSPMHHGPKEEEILPSNSINVECFQIFMLGANGVGKAALVSQFRTSECINAYEGPGKNFFFFLSYKYTDFLTKETNKFRMKFSLYNEPVYVIEIQENGKIFYV